MFNAIIFSVITIFFSYGNVSCAITVNGKNLNSIINPSQVLVYETKMDHIVIKIKDGNIEIGSVKLSNLEAAQEYYNELEDTKDQLCQKRAEDTLSIKAGQIEVNHAYLEARNKVIVKSLTDLSITSAILKSKEVELIAQELKFSACFLNTDTADSLQIESNSPTSLIELIRFTFNKDLPVPAAIKGEINFVKNETNELLIAVRAQKVRIQFREHAFKE